MMWVLTLHRVGISRHPVPRAAFSDELTLDQAKDEAAEWLFDNARKGDLDGPKFMEWDGPDSRAGVFNASHNGRALGPIKVRLWRVEEA